MTTTTSTPQMGAPTPQAQGQQQSTQQTGPKQIQQGGGAASGTSFSDWASI